MTAAVDMSALAVHRSRKLIPEFRLHRPRTAAEAVAIKTAAGPGAVYMAGGIDVVNRMKFGAPIGDVIHLGGLAGLAGVDDEGDGLRLGALVTHDTLALSPKVRARLPTLALTWPDVANIRIRCKGTLGGNLMAADPVYDFPLAAMAAGAQLHFFGSAGTVSVSAGSDPPSPDALLTAISFPPASRLRLIFDRSLRPLVTVAIGLEVADDHIVDGRVAIGCAYPRPFGAQLPIESPQSPSALRQQASQIAEAVAAALPEPTTDHHASGAYRRRMVEVLLRRHLAALT